MQCIYQDKYPTLFRDWTCLVTLMNMGIAPFARDRSEAKYSWDTKSMLNSCMT